MNLTRPTPTLRALKDQMRQAARNFDYIVGSGADGEVFTLGRWIWHDGGQPLPVLPPLPAGATPRQHKDHRVAEGLLETYAKKHILRDNLLELREILAEAVEGQLELQHNFRGAELFRQKKKLGETLRGQVGTQITGTARALEQVRKARHDLARESLRFSDANALLEALGEAPLPADAEGDEVRDGTIRAMQQAAHDLAIAAALKPLDPTAAALVLEHRRLPDVLNDERVLAAIFRVPGVLVPYTAEQMQAIAQLSFERGWPKTASVLPVIEAMVGEIQPVAGLTLLQIGKLIDPGQPFEVFRSMQNRGGRWALEGIAHQHRSDPAARAVLEDLRNHAGVAA
ncbi:hypothetical protein [Azohydromonas sp.]|uniref:hypothetical protein n=1 Tax=Azohydromonas sp. TaxID=1872666 RepID=UPI002B7D19F1|nr:hypothetical protein [Azohydromonas sp.]HMM87068.1 hypothetical protein [Azohydromonas sp.]